MGSQVKQNPKLMLWGFGLVAFYGVRYALSEQLAHSAVDLRLKEISEFLHGSEMNKCCSTVTPQSAA